MLRRPPLGQVLASAHDMGREYKIISALAGTDVPVAPALGLCTDPAVNGSPFYVMAFVDGVICRSATDAALLSESAQGRGQERGLHRPPVTPVERAVRKVEGPSARSADARFQRPSQPSGRQHSCTGTHEHRARRLSPRQLHIERRRRGDRGSRLGDVHARRSDGRSRSAVRLLGGPRRPCLDAASPLLPRPARRSMTTRRSRSSSAGSRAS